MIDDNELDNLISSRIIKKSNFASVIDAKSSAEEGLEFLKQLQSDFPSLIFLDLMMPMMDGFGFLDEFDKLDDSIKNHSKVVVLSSSVNPADIERATSNSNVIKFVSKPLTVDILASINENK